MAEAITVPTVPRILADDVTPEALASLMASQKGRLALISAEGGPFDGMAGRYSKLPNLDIYLKGHAGDPVRVDRQGRKPEFIERPALTIGVACRSRSTTFRPFFSVARWTAGKVTAGASPRGGTAVRSSVVWPGVSAGKGRTTIV